MYWIASALALIFIVVATGAAVACVDRRRLSGRKVLISEYYDLFTKWYNSQDERLYKSLLLRSEEAQAALGRRFGILSVCQPFQQRYVSTFVVLDLVPRIEGSQRSQFDQYTNESLDYAKMVESSLLRFVGWCESQIKDRSSLLKNPFRLYLLGVRQIVSLPVLCLHEFGLISSGDSEAIIGSRAYRIIDLLAALATIGSTISMAITGIR